MIFYEYELSTYTINMGETAELRIRKEANLYLFVLFCIKKRVYFAAPKYINMKKILLSVVILTIGFTSTLFAQTQDEMKAWQTYMTPGDVHKMMAKGNGEWTQEVTMWMQPGAPPTKSQATCKNEMIMGGRYQLSKTTGNMMGMPFEGMSLVGYDNAKKVFSSTWIDNFGTGTMHLEGTWDDATKTITFMGKMLDPMTGEDQDVKETMQMIDDDTQKMEMFVMKDGGEFKTMEINFKRKK